MRKKIYCIVLILLIILSLKVNRVTFHFDILYQVIAVNANEHEFFDASIFYWNVAKKLNPDINWYDFYIGKNKLEKAAKIETMTPEKERLLDEALKYYEQELTKNPNNFATICGIASVYKYKEDFEKAIEYLEIAHKQKPDDLWVLSEFTNIYSLKHDYKKMLFYADKYLTIKSDDKEIYFSKAFALDGLERKEEAVEWYKKYLASNPDNRVAPLVNLSSLEIDLNNWEDAEKHVDEAMQLNPYSTYLLSEKVDILIHKKQYDEAEKLAKSFTHTKYLFYWALAEIEYLRGNKEKSEEYFELSKQDAKEYYDNYCNGKNYDMYNHDGVCRNHYDQFTNFEKSKSETIRKLMSH